MRDSSSELVRLNDYAPPSFWIRSVELEFDLDPDDTQVYSRLFVERNLQVTPHRSLVLQGEDLILTEVRLDGKVAEYRLESGALVVDQLPESDTFTLEIRSRCSPALNTALSGLYTSGGGFFTQCEAEGFRRITYFLDRPDVMAVFTVTLRADRSRSPVLLSNGNLVEASDLGDGRHLAKWHDPFPKPSYLFALVAADLDVRERHVRSSAGRQHLLQIFVRHGDLDKTEHAMNVLVESIAWDEARFGLALDLDRFMVVAVGDFNAGAMENKGLNIFNTKFVLASPDTATDDDYFGIESVVSHEYFHNWTGNRVTCRDWFQLSLKEGLTVYREQEYMGDVASSAAARGVRRINDVRILRALQFVEDAGSMAHPVRPDSYVKISNFYTPTVYKKGAEVVRMMQTLVGRDGFREGLDLYFKRHDGQAVTCDDFAQAIADACPDSALASNLAAFKRWYSQSGTPRLEASGSFNADDGTYELTLRQPTSVQHANSERLPFVIPLKIALLGQGGTPLPLRLDSESGIAPTERVLVLTGREQTFTFGGLSERPTPSLLRDFSAPVLLDDDLTDDDLLRLFTHDRNVFSRWESGQRLALRSITAAVADLAASTAGRFGLSTAYVAAVRALLGDPALDDGFKALALTLPTETMIAQQFEVVDPQRIHDVREAFREQLAELLKEDFKRVWDTRQVRAPYRFDTQQTGQRALVNTALRYLLLGAERRGDAAWSVIASERVGTATNMTDAFASLEALVEVYSDRAGPALEQFHARFAADALVIDKWFALQAGTPESRHVRAGSTYERVLALGEHPDFHVKNPNRARSLILTYCQNNPSAFHRTDGAGYAYWAKSVREIDAFNPSVAARLARAMDSWSQLAEPFRTAARASIEGLASHTDLSVDVREVIDRALQC